MMNGPLGGSGGTGGSDRDPFRNHNSGKTSSTGTDNNSSSSNRFKRIRSTGTLSACEATVASSVTEQNGDSAADGTSGAMTSTAMMRHGAQGGGRRLALRTQAFHLSIASGASAGILVLYTIPAQALVGMAIVIALFMALMSTLYQRAVLEYNAMVEGRGIGDALPESIFDQLVNMSLHDYMMSPTSSPSLQDYSFLALYFMPGLTQDQIDRYVDRLSPGHRDMLRRRGLGNFLGNGFMRLLLGDERLNTIRETVQEGEEVPIIHQGTSSTAVPQRLNLENRAIEDDETSALGEEDAQHQASAATTTRGLIPAIGRTVALVPSQTARNANVQTPASQGQFELRSIAPSAGSSRSRSAVAAPAAAAPTNAIVRSRGAAQPSNTPAESNNDNVVDEISILADALRASVTSYTGTAISTAVSSARSAALGAFNFLAGTATRASLTITFLSTGIGLFGMWAGVYDINRLSGNHSGPRPPLRIPASYQHYFPSATLLWNASMASSTASSIFMTFGLGARQHRAQQPSKPDDKQQPSSK